MKDWMIEKYAWFQTKLLFAQNSAEDGMTTAEYAIGTIAAAAFAGVLLAVVKGGGIKGALTAIIQKALSI